MNSADSQESMDRIADILASLRKKNVRLWSENGQLRYKASKGALTQAEIEELRVSRDQIVALVERAAGAATVQPRLEPRPRLDRAPLAFSQLAHWHLYQLSKRRSARHVACALRLRGRLDIGALRESVSEVVRRHDALRTRIAVVDGVPAQEIAGSGGRDLEVDDLTALSASLREIEVKRLFEKYAYEPIDVTVDPLFAVRLLRVRDDEHVLIVAMEHMISDGVSRDILLRDLFAAYMQALKHGAFSLPAIPVQFADYAVWQRNGQKSWLENHSAYWNERLAGCPRLRFPVDKSLPIQTHLGGWGLVPFRIGRDLKAQLLEWCRLRRTSLVMSVFTAYVGLVLRWCNVSDAVIQYQTDGRFTPEIQNTIGYFAFRLHLRVELLENDGFVDLLKRVTAEYCKAYEHADFSYMEAEVPRPEFTRSTCFNWLAQEPRSDHFELAGSGDAITCSRLSFEQRVLANFELDAEPTIGLLETDDEIRGWVSFPLARFPTDTMERFARNFLLFVRALLGQPEERVKDIVLQ